MTTAQTQAQDNAWLQIDAQPTEAEAEESARYYESFLPDVAGFALASGWYVIALGILRLLPKICSKSTATRGKCPLIVLPAMLRITHDNFGHRAKTYWLRPRKSPPPCYPNRLWNPRRNPSLYLRRKPPQSRRLRQKLSPPLL